MFSSRIPWDLQANPLSKILAEKEKQNLKSGDYLKSGDFSYKPIIYMTESNPTRCGLEYASDAILKAISPPRLLFYEPHPKGLLEARKAISEYYQTIGREVNPHNVILTASTSEAYSFLFKLLGNWGDSVLVPHPSYPLFEYLATLEGIQLVPYQMEYIHPAGWFIDLDNIRTAINSRTKAVIIVNPNNPTGSYIQEGELKELIAICKNHQLVLISDEVFCDYQVDIRKTAIPSLAGQVVHPDKVGEEILTFVLNGFSKMLGLPQLKLGWIVSNGPDELLQQALDRLELIADTFLSVGTQVQLATPDLLLLRDAFQQQVIHRLKDNVQIIEATIRDTPFRLLRCEGGWSAVLEIPRFIPEEEVVSGLLLKENTLVHPGYFFDFPREGYIVFSLLIQSEIMGEGMKRIVRYFNRLGG